MEGARKFVSVERDASITIAAIYSTIYGILGVIGFVGWIIINIDHSPGYEYLFALTTLQRWTERLQILGPVALIIGILSLTAASLLWKSKRLGAYLNIISFAIGFIANLLIARHPLDHAIVGSLAGLVLLLPIAAGWKSLKP